ncbi:MAG TPA: PIG-L deacetylase family protein [Acidimicrobiales bacterium]|nr:PIG-L deacetylase family protein [Acidimicrobiales bacterium]
MRRVLVVVAHPDDVDFASAGTVAALVDAGAEVTYCIVTDGQAGGSDRSVSRSEMAALRRKEQVEAAARVGVTDLRFLGYPDGRLTPSLELRRDLSRVIRQVRPERVVGPSPERVWASVYASHPDHLAAGEATMCAVYPDARNPFAHPELLESEGLEPHTVDELWVTGGPDPDLAVDITATFDRKLAALRCHASQVGDVEDLEGMLRRWGADNAARAGLPPGSLAELYRTLAAR